MAREGALKPALARVLVPLTALWGVKAQPAVDRGVAGGQEPHDSPSLLCPSALCKSLVMFAKLRCIK